MLPANGGNIFQRIAPTIELVSAQTDQGGRELATAYSLGRGWCDARYYLRGE